jgi:hypothetical protein
LHWLNQRDEFPSHPGEQDLLIVVEVEPVIYYERDIKT